VRLGRFEISLHVVIALVAVAAMVTWLILFDETAIGLLRASEQR
jgi:hypothetical protein